MRPLSSRLALALASLYPLPVLIAPVCPLKSRCQSHLSHCEGLILAPSYHRQCPSAPRQRPSRHHASLSVDDTALSVVRRQLQVRCGSVHRGGDDREPREARTEPSLSRPLRGPTGAGEQPRPTPPHTLQDEHSTGEPRNVCTAPKRGMRLADVPCDVLLGCSFGNSTPALRTTSQPAYSSPQHRKGQVRGSSTQQRARHG